MNLEARTMSKGLWWDGYYGGVCKDSQFAMLYHKPNIAAVITEYDAVSCYPNAGPEANIVVVKGVARALNKAEISGIDAMIDTVFPDAGGGGGSSGGVTNLRVSEVSRAITFTDEAGRAGRLPFAEIKATPMEFYLDVSQPSATTKFPNAVLNAEYVVPIGAPSMTGRNHYITVDRANNRVLIPEGGLRGTFRLYGAFRFTPSIKSDMSISLTWYYRRQGSSEAWNVLYTGTTSRTASQTTAAISFPTSSAYYNLPDYPVECEARLRFVTLGTVPWTSTPIFDDVSDGLKISLYRNPNFEYTT